MNTLVDTFVPVDLLDELKERIEVIQKRAKRINFPVPTVEYLETVTGNAYGHDKTPASAEVLERYRKEGDFASARRNAAMDWRHVILSGEPLKKNGWTLVASIDGIVQKDASVVAYFRPVPGQEIPKSYRDAVPNTCEHCGLSRWRTETFLVGHEDGSYMQVGRQCIRDFLGWSPDSLVPFLKLYGELIGFADSDAESWGSRATPEYTPEDVIRTAARVVAHDGFYQSAVKKAAAELSEDHDNMWSTKDRVLLLLDPPTNKWDRQFHAEYNDPAFDEKTERIVVETDAGIAELLLQDAKSDWAWSIETAFNAKYLKRHQLGVIASSVILGLKRIEGEREKKEYSKGPQSEYVGQVGDKVSTTVTVTDVRFVNSGFGSSSLISMVDDSGNVFKTFYSGSAADPVVEQRIDIRGTIKKHEEYKGRKSTVLTRYKWEIAK